MLQRAGVSEEEINRVGTEIISIQESREREENLWEDELRAIEDALEIVHVDRNRRKAPVKRIARFLQSKLTRCKLLLRLQ